ncbi:hypothetical protein P691DRAFT_759301 [Macrolepiota fuliginosa MF-IS2]|uniref:Nephrocystin 3-like N-terminal domain-containing protein n=1 Tax=Macrolepiota fuliginosa MF-IS2 TaxID=1400762 RepID=A0A9P5XDT2_9AGAR|nr:hypothetical protein P691DRAFT_759301 [Macrolepiota fuliginosa MF-IS2]
MSFFNESRRTKIIGGIFKNKSTTNVHNINNSGPSGIDILLEASYPGAAFDSSARDQPPRCWPGTRAEHIEFITDWSGLSWADQPPPMLWIDGPAGVGKSAVAQTCSEKLKPLGRLRAAFFFSTLDKRDKHSHFFPTIAYQLCTEFPDYRDIVDRKVLLDKTLVDKMMVSQFKELIVEPLQELERRGKGIGKQTIIVDGLDECADPDAQCEIIEIIAESIRERTTPLCWAIFSRPEPNIQATFSKATVSPFFRQCSLPISREFDAQIELYLRGGFRDILLRCSLPKGTLSAWPSDDDMRILVEASGGGLFVYAATILHFVGQADSSLGPDGLLKEVLILIRGNPDAEISSDRPFARLDTFYRLIMERIPANALSSLQLLLGSILFGWRRVSFDNVSDSFRGAMLLANMLQLSEFDFRALQQIPRYNLDQ